MKAFDGIVVYVAFKSTVNMCYVHEGQILEKLNVFFHLLQNV